MLQIEKLVRHVAAKENVENCKIVYNYTGNKSDGLMSIIQAISLSGSNKTLEIVLKLSEGDCGAFPKRYIFTNEIICYEKILPAYAKLNAEHHIADPFDNFIKFYGANKEVNKECVVLENIKVRNFHMWNGRLTIDDAHLQLVFKTLAKLHGTSFAFKAFHPKAYSRIAHELLPSEAVDEIFEKMAVSKQFGYLASYVVDLFDEHVEFKYWKKMRDYADSIGDSHKDSLKYRSDVGVILRHGDCWSNNFMFQYEDCNDGSRPTNVKLYDFQFAQEGPPVMDLANFLYVSASQAILDNEQHYLQLYHDALAHHVRQFHLNINTIYSMRDLRADWKRFCHHGFNLALLLGKVKLIHSQDATNFDHPEFVNGLELSDANSMLYNQQMRQLVKHCVDREYI